MAWTEITRAHCERRCGRYASDLTDAEWALIAPMMPSANRIGRPRKTDLREVVNALLYLASSGGAWRLLPKDFPPFSTVQKYFYRWREEGLLRTISNSLVMAAREAEGREASPTAGVIDSQSVKTTESGGIHGFDAGKKINGRKRHIVVDTIGLMVGLVVHAADIQDRDGAPAALKTILERWPWLRHLFADGGYAGPKLKGALQKIGTFTLEIVKRTDKAKGFEVLPRRWVVECAHSHGWGDAAGWPRTGRNPSLPQKPGYTSPTFACLHAGSQELDIKPFFLIQALNASALIDCRTTVCPLKRMAAAL